MKIALRKHSRLRALKAVGPGKCSECGDRHAGGGESYRSPSLLRRVADRSERLQANASVGGNIINRIERANSYLAPARPFGKPRGSSAVRY